MFGVLGRIHYVRPFRVIAIYQIKCHKIAITNQRTKGYESQSKNSSNYKKAKSGPFTDIRIVQLLICKVEE